MSAPTVVYDSARRPPVMLEEAIHAYRYRDLIKQLIRRDVLTRYKRSVLGVAWTMLNPLGMMVVLTLAFSSLFSTTRAFAVYLLIGLIVWGFFAQTTTAAMSHLAWGGTLIHRIYIPRTVFAISSVGTGLVNLILSLVPLAGVMAVTRTPLRAPALFLPVALLLLALFALGVGLLLSALAVYFPDVTEMYQIALLAWMYLTPIIYPEEIVPEAYRPWMFGLNPMYYLVRLFRLPLYTGVWPSLADVGSSAVISLGVVLGGWLIFTKRADEFAYRV